MVKLQAEAEARPNRYRMNKCRGPWDQGGPQEMDTDPWPMHNPFYAGPMQQSKGMQYV